MENDIFDLDEKDCYLPQGQGCGVWAIWIAIFIILALTYFKLRN